MVLAAAVSMLHSVDATPPTGHVCQAWTTADPAAGMHGDSGTGASRSWKQHAPESRVPPSVLPSTITQMTTAPRQPHDSALEAIQTAFMLQQDA